ncbi:MAG: hemerythrin family protein [Betaproteobacteria bacterium]|nr:hemerythrin family protein [Betaproteobacteria bacterium]
MTTELFTWNNEFSVGIQEVDEQHKMLVGLLNQLHEAIRDHHGSDTSRQILDRLAEYTRTHFTLEESLMRVTNYPEFPPHKQQHEELIGQIKALQEKLDSGKATISFELLHFLKIWLMKHINETDKRFARHFLGAPLAPTWSPEVEETMNSKKAWWKFW